MKRELIGMLCLLGIGWFAIGCSEDKDNVDNDDVECREDDECVDVLNSYKKTCYENRCLYSCYHGYKYTDGKCEEVPLIGKKMCDFDRITCLENNICEHGYQYDEKTDECYNEICYYDYDEQFVRNGDYYESDMVCARRLYIPNIKTIGINVGVKIRYPKLKFILGNAEIDLKNDFQDYKYEDGIKGVISLDFSALTYVETMYIRNNTFLEEIKLPVLKTTDTLVINKNYNLKDVQLNSLENLNALRFSDNTSLENINLPDANFTTNELFIKNNGLKNIQLSSIEKLDKLEISENKHLENIKIDSIKKVDHLVIMDNLNLNNINFPILGSIDYLVLVNNKELKELHMPLLKSLVSKWMEDNPKLETIEWQVDE